MTAPVEHRLAGTGIGSGGSWPLACSIVVVPRLSCFAACGILPDQRLNLCLQHCQMDSPPLSHQGTPPQPIFILIIFLGLELCVNLVFKMYILKSFIKTLNFIYLAIFGRNFHKWFLFFEQNRVVDTIPTEKLPRKSLNSCGVLFFFFFIYFY